MFYQTLIQKVAVTEAALLLLSQLLKEYSHFIRSSPKAGSNRGMDLYTTTQKDGIHKMSVPALQKRLVCVYGFDYFI